MREVHAAQNLRPDTTREPVGPGEAVRILVVEDASSQREALIELLGDEGYDAYGAGSVKEAVAACSESAPDLVLLDYTLPDGKAPDVVAQLRQLGCACRIILVTGSAELRVGERGIHYFDDHIDEAAELRIAGHVAKPIDLTKLFALIEN